MIMICSNDDGGDSDNVSKATVKNFNVLIEGRRSSVIFAGQQLFV